MNQSSPQETKFSWLSSKQTQKYTQVRKSDDSESSGHNLEVDSSTGSSKDWSTAQVVVLVLFAVAISSVCSFILGSRHGAPIIVNALSPMGEVAYPMIYNKTFTLAPSPESNAAWDAMFPSGFGFVKHPKLAPEPSGLAVFHELHCINALRNGYYAALDHSSSPKDGRDDHEHLKHEDAHHLRHCFDYLRQSIICAADTNIEPIDFELGGVTGWQPARKCRDFEGVKEWAEQNKFSPPHKEKETPVN